MKSALEAMLTAIMAMLRALQMSKIRAGATWNRKVLGLIRQSSAAGAHRALVLPRVFVFVPLLADG